MKSVFVRHQLVRQIAYGNQHAFEELFFLYYQPLCQFAFLFLKSRELSEEIVSDVYLKMWLHRTSLSKVKNIRSYLYSAVRNLSIDYQRSKKNVTEDTIDPYILEISSTDPSAYDIIEEREKIELLQKAIDELPERCRIILRLHLNEELRSKEIAEILNISHKTVESQIAIAIRKLTHILSPEK